MPTTRFLVVSNLKPASGSDNSRLSTTDPAVARAERRGQQVIELLLDFGFPNNQGQTQKVDRRQILHWVYAFSKKKDETLLYEEQPVPGSDPSQSVWVFRIDCATPKAAAPTPPPTSVGSACRRRSPRDAGQPERQQHIGSAAEHPAGRPDAMSRRRPGLWSRRPVLV